MSAKNIVMAAAGNSAGPTYVDDVFSTHLYDGTGLSRYINNGVNLAGTKTAVAQDVASKFSTTVFDGNGGAQTITNGVNLSANGGLVWLKSRTSADTTGSGSPPGYGHGLFDTARGVTKVLFTNSTAAQATYSDAFTSFNSNGFSLGDVSYNYSNQQFVAWTFRKAANFFDVVTFTASSSTDQRVSHSLGSAPGVIILKNTQRNDASGWLVYHRSQGRSSYGQLNATGAFSTLSNAWGSTDPTATDFGVNASSQLFNGENYVAYLFAHDTASNGMVQCGTYTGNGLAAGPTVTLGWRPQWLLIKRASGGSSDWTLIDNMRGIGESTGNEGILIANGANAEVLTHRLTTTATGFQVTDTGTAVNASGSDYIYVAIRTDQDFDNSRGGMVWAKCRSNTYDHVVFDTARGSNNYLITSSTAAQNTSNVVGLSFSDSGFLLTKPTAQDTLLATGEAFTSWTFRKAAKFFDVVTFTSNGSTTQTVNHSLGVTPGFIIIKRTDATSNWFVWHRGDGTTDRYTWSLNNGAAASSSGSSFVSSGFFNSTSFQPNRLDDHLGNFLVNGGTYVAYLFAHDAASDGMIQCGAYTTNGSGAATVNLGFEPQWLLVKAASGGLDNWYIVDQMLGMPVSTTIGAQYLSPNSTSREGTYTQFYPTATGFSVSNVALSTTYVYIAIRRPNKPPTSGTQVFQPTVYTGTNVDNRLVNTTIAPDMVWVRQRNASSFSGMVVGDRLRGQLYSLTGAVATETSAADAFDRQLVSATEYGTAFSAMSGFWCGNNATALLNTNTTSNNHIAEAFRRAPGFFDHVCYTGTGSALTVKHNLTVVPELAIIKGRDSTANWLVETPSISYGGFRSLRLNTSGGGTTSFFTTLPTATEFYPDASAFCNTAAINYTAYLFASLPGISKVGSYTGNGGAADVNGTSQTINCGFSVGARFVLIKRTDSAGLWYVFDNARGIVAANDPYMPISTSSPEQNTADVLDPDNSGFIVNQTSGENLNVTNATYIYLAIA